MISYGKEREIEKGENMEGVIECSANYIALSPISFLERAATVYADQLSIVYGNSIRFTWSQTHRRCLLLASALSRHLHVSYGDTVITLAPNIPALYELHFGVPMAGAVISSLNTKLNADMLAKIVQQLNAKVMFVDYQHIHIFLQAHQILSTNKSKPPLLVIIQEIEEEKTSMIKEELPCQSLTYESLISMGDFEFEIVRPISECDPISVSYTSGSTGNPKGVVYSHRAAYLNSLASLFRIEMRRMPVFLWTVDMFRCNGWCFTWAMPALGGTNICLRSVSGKVIFDAIFLHKVTHLSGAPTILNMIANMPVNDQKLLTSKVDIIVAGALPAKHVLKKVEEQGFKVNIGYGMTEVLGPAIVIPWKSESESDSFALDEQEKIKYLEGTHNLMMEGVDVKDVNTMKSVPNDGKTIGEVMFRGNTLMRGYLKNKNATQEAFKGEWYRTGDVGIKNPNGCIQMKDRAIDIIISGEQIVSTIEVEAVVMRHPKVREAAVIGRKDHDSGEVPCAFVKLKEGCDANGEEIIEFCRCHLPQYMVPQTVVFGDLPKNSTGKIQKILLREKVKKMAA